MPRISIDEAGGINVCAFLDMLGYSEIGPAMLADPETDDGYRVLVGSLPGRYVLFKDYSHHPLPAGKAIQYSPGVWSTAAGRYQILSRYWPHYQKRLGLHDFGPKNQDRYAVQQIKEQRALDDIKAGRFRVAVDKCRNIWASLPGAGYGQREHDMETLAKVYADAGGWFEGDDFNWYTELDKRL